MAKRLLMFLVLLAGCNAPAPTTTPPADSPWRACPACDGKGRIYGPCSHCKGTGRQQSDKGHWHPCLWCDGKAFYGNLCDDCDGTGKVGK